MRVDDIQWSLNRTTNQYEIVMYSADFSDRVVCVEFDPLVLAQVTQKILHRIGRDFPSRNPAMDVRASGPQPAFTPRDSGPQPVVPPGTEAGS